MERPPQGPLEARGPCPGPDRSRSTSPHQITFRCRILRPASGNPAAPIRRPSRGDRTGMSTVRLEAASMETSGNSNNDGADSPAVMSIAMQPASLDIWDKKYRLVTKD